jgi:hypothetical protein
MYNILNQQTMVTVIDFKKAVNAAGKEFFLLILMGGVSFVKSTITGNFYATAWKTSITSTFTEDVCKTLIGTKLPGEIEKVDVEEPYEYKIPTTGETIILHHKSANQEPKSMQYIRSKYGSDVYPTAQTPELETAYV